MYESLQRLTVFAAYQLTVVVGLAMLPLAVLARRAGVTLPLGRLVERMDEAYEQVSR